MRLKLSRLQDDTLLKCKTTKHNDRIVQAPSERQKLLMQVHEVSGHSNWLSTLALVEERFFCPGMRQHVQSHVAACPDCTRFRKKLTKYEKPLEFPRGDFPFERVSIDLIGPLVPTNLGNANVIVVIDSATGFVEAQPPKSKTAEEVLDSLRNSVVHRYGVPKMFSQTTALSLRMRLSLILQRKITLAMLLRRHTSFPQTGVWNGQTRHHEFSKIQLAKAKKLGFIPTSCSFWVECNAQSNGNSPYMEMFNRRPLLTHAEHHIKLSVDAPNKSISQLQHTNHPKLAIGEPVMIQNQTRTKLDPIGIGPYIVDNYGLNSYRATSLCGKNEKVLSEKDIFLLDLANPRPVLDEEIVSI